MNAIAATMIAPAARTSPGPPDPTRNPPIATARQTMDNVLKADVFDILGPFVDASYGVLTECWLLWPRAPQVRPAPASLR
jgi:hypothetical protein